MGETKQDRLKRLKMRSWRRGIKEMDLILGPFSDTELEGLDEAQITVYDAMLSENDHDLYQWVTGRVAAPPEYLELLKIISEFAFKS
ncbi:FAD assembly factor SdhE [Profundibacter amoris]|uniref:FAD assembly factor SdhE n=1 Tax=Profundibacter amoris TaxID=2171755 RepID=A0A347UI69_9RHOB|nr:succinate dehydrogenase assembly factor 2 [Profundibacter amoris]AXX98547.1 succinate dehydrogenase assembly factor 2 [Profundibacter amoris]